MPLSGIRAKESTPLPFCQVCQRILHVSSVFSNMASRARYRVPGGMMSLELADGSLTMLVLVIEEAGWLSLGLVLIALNLCMSGSMNQEFLRICRCQNI